MTQPEPNLYDYWPYQGRPKIRWPGDKKLAFWIAPNIEYYEWNPPANPQRKPWPRGNPDIVGYSQRTWGNQVGHWRLMELLDRYDLRGSISLSVGLIDHHPEIIEACAASRLIQWKLIVEIVIEIVPVRITLFNKLQLPVTLPFLDLVFARLRRLACVTSFIPDKPLDPILATESAALADAVFPSAPTQVICVPSIEGPISVVREQVDVKQLHTSW